MSLHLEEVAEGVVTAVQLEQLKALGCRFGQGYLFTRPVPGNVIEALLAEGAVTGQGRPEPAGAGDRTLEL